jgi:hypothetical protein
VPAQLVPDDQLWFHQPEVQARVRQAEEEIAAGRSTRTDTPPEAQAFLDSLKAKPNPQR